MTRQSHRFLHYTLTLNRDRLECMLEGEEHHHASRVLRLRPGDTTFVTNGSGLLAECAVDAARDDSTLLTVQRFIDAAPAPPHVTLAAALLKRDAFELLVRQCTEVGVVRFIPFVAEKSHVREYSAKFMARLEKIALTAMKQSFRAVLPSVEPVRSFDDIAALSEHYDRTLVGDSCAPRVGRVAAANVLAVVGPEGGLTGDETGRLRVAGSSFVSVVPGRLRSETAAAVLAGALRSGATNTGGLV